MRRPPPASPRPPRSRPPPQSATARSLALLLALATPAPAGGLLRPATDVMQRLEYDAGLDATRFSFYYREAQEPLRRRAAWDAPNDGVNSTARVLRDALPQHRIGFFTYGRRLVWHRARRVDRVFGSGRTPDARIGDVVAGYAAWDERRRAAARAVGDDVRARLGPRRFDRLLETTRSARRREAAPAAWLDDVGALLDSEPAPLAALVASMRDVALREGLADALEARGAPLAPRLWIDEF